jgi:O-antigen ligase
MNQSKEQRNIAFSELFSSKKSIPFFLLLLLLFFNSFRPDRLLHSGSIMLYFPTLVIIILLCYWLGAEKKVLANSQTKYYILIILLMIFQLPFVRNFGFSYLAVKSVLIYGITSYLFLVQFIDNYKNINKYIRLYVILGIFFAILGITGAGSVSIPVLGDENDFCLFINIMIPFAFFLGQEAQEFKKKCFYNTLVVIYITANISSFSRGGFIGLVAVALYLFYQTKHKVFYLVFAGLVALAIVNFASPQYLAEISGIDTKSYQRDTGATRIEAWKAGWKMFKDHPVLGVGVYNFGPWLPDYYDNNLNPATMWGRVAHSLYFTLLSEMGIVGTLFFIGMLCGNYKDHSFICSLEGKKADYLASSSSLTLEEKEKIADGIRTLYFFSKAYSGAMVAYLVTGVFISVLWYGYFWMLSAFWVMTSNIARRSENLLVTSQAQSIVEGHAKKTLRGHVVLRFF